MRSLAVSTDVSPAEWDRFVASHPAASGYHSWIWRDIFESAFGHETRYLAARADGVLTGVLPLVVFRSWMFGRFVVSLPFVNYGGVLAADEASAQALLEQAVEVARGIGAAHVELRHTERVFEQLPCRCHKVAMLLPVPASREAAWTALDRKARNQVRKAERSSLTVVSGKTELLDAFYDVFAHNMRDLGTPVYPKAFFEAVLTRLADRAECIVVKSGREPVAAGITLRWRDGVEIPWASSLKEHRASCPNMLLYWTLLERAIAAGLAVLDFGRSSPDSGTYHFKRQWGAIAHPLYWEYGMEPGRSLPDLGPTNPKFGPAIAAWKRLPIRVANAIGPHIVRSIP